MPAVTDPPRPREAAGSLPYTAAVRVSPREEPPTRHLALLERAVTVALSALEYPDLLAWGEALTVALCALADSPTGAVLLPGSGDRWRAVTIPPTTDDGVSAFGIHDETTERYREYSDRDLVIWARDDLATGERVAPPCPRAVAVGLRVRAPGGLVASVCVQRNEHGVRTPEIVIAALRAIAPAFSAGIEAWASRVAARENVTRMLDTLCDAALLFDVTGALVHANPVAQRLVATGDGARLQAESQRIAWTLGAVVRRPASRAGAAHPFRDAPPLPDATRRVRTSAGPMRLRGAIVGGQLFGAGPAILVLISAAEVEPLSDEALRDRFGLTVREIQVARLVAEGLSNTEIAERLGVRFFTARNHVERTLAKLGVSSRHRIGPLLRNDAAPDNIAA